MPEWRAPLGFLRPHDAFVLGNEQVQLKQMLFGTDRIAHLPPFFLFARSTRTSPAVENAMSEPSALVAASPSAESATALEPVGRAPPVKPARMLASPRVGRGEGERLARR